MQKNSSKMRKRVSSGTFLKIIMLGDSNVGKTTLINRYVGGFYHDSLTSTLGMDFKVKRLEVDGQKINLQIWDTAGQQKFKTLTKSYFQGCMGVLITFSLIDRRSYQNINSWINSIHELLPSNIPKILIGTKVDCFQERQVSIQECSEFTFQYDLEYLQISSKTGYNVDNAFQSLAQKIMKGPRKAENSHFRSEQQKTPESCQLSTKIDSSENNRNSKKCSC